MMQVVAPCYTVPDVNYFKLVRLPVLYDVVQAQVEMSLARVEFVAITTDCWTAENTISCINLICVLCI